MLLPNGDGTYTGGSLDALHLLRNVKTNRLHVCFFEEAPFPGPVQEVDEVEIVRLKSGMHHTTGATTIEEANAHFDEMKAKIQMPEENYFREPMDWNGEIPIVRIVPNWRKKAA